MTPRQLIEPARLAGSALLHTQSDERLVDLARAGNDRAFEAIVGRYRRPLLRYCRRLLPPERAEDAVQQTFLNAYRAIGAGEDELHLRAWLYRIAHNASLSLLRQNGWSHEELDESFDGVQQPPQAVEQREQVRAVVRAVQDLPERQRSAMVLRELEGRSYEEIAAELGVTGGAVRQLLNRARTTLRTAATAITPGELAAWAAARGGSGGPVAERIAELTAGAGFGGMAAAAKLGAAVVIAGAVAGAGNGVGPLPGVLDRDGAGSGAEDAMAAEEPPAGGDAAGAKGVLLGRRDGRGTGRDGRRGRGRGAAELDDDRGGDRSDDDDRSGGSGSDDSDSGSGSDSAGSDSSGSGSSGSDDDSSGSGSSGSGSSGSGSSGSGSGDDFDSSGPGSGLFDDSSGSGSSGSGSSGSGSSGSGSDSSGSGSGTSGSGTSGSGTSGTSGSGSGSSGSGSADD